MSSTIKTSNGSCQGLRQRLSGLWRQRKQHGSHRTQAGARGVWGKRARGVGKAPTGSQGQGYAPERHSPAVRPDLLARFGRPLSTPAVPLDGGQHHNVAQRPQRTDTKIGFE